MSQEVVVSSPGSPPVRVEAVPVATDAVANKDDSVARFLTIVGEVIGVDDVPGDQHFLDIGGDSLSVAIIIEWVDQEFSVEPELDWFFEAPTVDEIAAQWWSKVEGSRADLASPADVPLTPATA